MQESNYDIHIRHFQSDTDAMAVCKIWVNGLEQTVNAKWWPTQPLWRFLFARMAKKAIKDNGDVGPDGKNLFTHWCEDKDNRCLLVAEKNSIASDVVTQSEVVGCIAVVRGTSNEVTAKVSSNEETFSVWKMSVADEFRRSGIGGKLLKAGEEWAVEHGCQQLRMITANPVASRFYQSHGYQLISSNRLSQYFGGWHEKQM